MDLETVEKGIAVIVKRELEAWHPQRLGGFTFTLTKEGEVIEYDSVNALDSLPLLVSDPKRERIRSDNFETLLSLYQKAASEEIGKQKFLEILVKVLGQLKPSQPNRLLYFCLLFLFRIKQLSSFVEMATRHPFTSPSLKVGILAMTSQILRYDYELVEEKDIVLFKEIISTLVPKPRPRPKPVSPGIPSVLGTVMARPTVTAASDQDNPLVKISKLIDKQITELQFRNLRLRLADINPVINEDKERSLRILDELGFDPKFSDGLSLIEDYFRKAEFSDQEAATCIAKIGGFILDFNVELIERIQSISKETFKGDRKDVASTIQYLKKHQVGFFNQKEAQLYKSVYDLCSDTGRHHLLSKKEHARISKNIMIELILLALQKLQKYSSDAKQESTEPR